MARVKMLGARVMGLAAWAAVAAATLGAAYGGSAIAAHCGSWIEWR